jgi:hypothetical protein
MSTGSTKSDGRESSVSDHSSEDTRHPADGDSSTSSQSGANDGSTDANLKKFDGGSACAATSAKTDPAPTAGEQKPEYHYPDWILKLMQEKKEDTRDKPWEDVVKGQAQDRHYLAYRPWDSADVGDKYYNAQDCPHCRGQGCSHCEGPITFAG